MLPPSTGRPPAAADRAPESSTLVVVPPPPDLAPLVEYVWQLVLPDAPALPGAVWRVVVDGYVDLASRLSVTPEMLQAAGAARVSAAARGTLAELLGEAPSVVCGAATTARVLPMTVPTLITGVRFRMGAAAGVLRNAPGELVDGSRPLADVVDRPGAAGAARARAAAARDVDRILDATGGADDPGGVLQAIALAGAEGMARRLVARAAARRGGAHPADARVRGALALLDRAAGVAPSAPSAGPPCPLRRAAEVRAGVDRVAAVARELAMSTRTLERLFAEHVGYAPRTYQRLRRVGAVAEALESGDDAGGAARGGRPVRPPATLSALAHALGYADHAHMTHEFTRVMGVTPSRYRREALARPVVRRFGAVAFERSIPLGTVGTRDVEPNVA